LEIGRFDNVVVGEDQSNSAGLSKSGGRRTAERTHPDYEDGWACV
jgi:hypothetical protein